MRELSGWAEDALLVQNASNGTGVCNSLLGLMKFLRDSGEANGTAEINKHPLVRLFIAKLADLAGMQYIYPTDADAWAASKSKGVNSGESEVRTVQ